MNEGRKAERVFSADGGHRPVRKITGILALTGGRKLQALSQTCTHKCNTCLTLLLQLEM